MYIRLFSTGFLVLAFASLAAGQQSAAEMKKKARELLGQGRYIEAKALISSSRELTRNDNEGRFLLAVSNFHLNQLDEALEQIRALGNQDRYPFPECRLYLGKIYHARHEFAEAGRQYKKYLKTLSSSNPLRRAVWNEVRRCQNGLDLQFKTAPAFVENLGPDVNTAGDEFGPVPSPNHIDRLYFSSIRPGNSGGKRDERGNPDETNGRYFSDMFSCRLIGGRWTQTQPLPFHLNSPRHEVLVDINSIGNALFYCKGLSLQKGEILVDTFRQGGATALTSDPFIGPMNPLEGEVSFQVFNDTLVIFSSQRPGGYGGFDLWKSSLRNGRWTEPENLGPEVNSAFDETAPFLLRDGRSLFFSSNNSAGSIGGLDIFKSIWAPRSKSWSAPENLGMPINSAADDSHFRISSDGFTAFFSSSRKDGYGLRDIYVAYFNEFLELDPIPVSSTPETVRPPALVRPDPAPTAPAVAAGPTPAPQQPPPSQPRVVEQPRPSVEEPPRAQVESQPRTTGTAAATILPAAEAMRNNPALHTEALQTTATWLKANADASISITAFVKSKEAPGTALFAGIRSAEAAARQLTAQGIAPQRIFVRAVSADWSDPAAGNHVLTLRRLPAPGKAAPEYEPLSRFSASAAYNKVLDQPLLFKVQVTSLKGEYRGELLSRHPDAMVEKSHGVDFYRYTLGAFASFTEADQFRRKLQSQGQSSAFITAYIHGFRMERGQARAYLSEFPDLRSYGGN